MGKLFASVRGHLRLWVQVGFAAMTNGYLAGFYKGRIYSGRTKAVCVPGLSCYSCPGALGACPVGSLQAVLGSREFGFSFYVIGFLILIGAVFGRFVCGWLCPFGLVQDLLHKIPGVKKFRKLPGDRFLKYLKYGILAGFVILLPLFAVDSFGQGVPAFCKYLCPSGTLMAGLPLFLADERIRAAAGWLFAWKNLILVVLIVLSIPVYRPFCRYLCPLGAIYGLFHPISFYRYRVDESKCTGCKTCQQACKLDIPVYLTPNSPDCIRCGACLKSCPEGALFQSFGRRKTQADTKPAE